MLINEGKAFFMIYMGHNEQCYYLWEIHMVIALNNSPNYITCYQSTSFKKLQLWHNKFNQKYTYSHETLMRTVM